MRKILDVLSIPILLVPAIYVILVIFLLSGENLWRWALSSVVTLILFPAISLFWLRYEKEITDLDLDVKKERVVSFGLLLLLYATSFFNSLVLEAPKIVQALNLTLLILVILLFAITQFWKISGHVLAIASMAVIIWLLQGAIALIFIPLAVFIGWHRYTLRHHTLGQIIAGGLLGTIVTFLIFTLYWL